MPPWLPPGPRVTHREAGEGEKETPKKLQEKHQCALEGDSHMTQNPRCAERVGCAGLAWPHLCSSDRQPS